MPAVKSSASAPKPPSRGAANQRAVNSSAEATASLTPELVIALCGPIGSPLHETAEQICNALREHRYTCENIRLSDLIKINATKVDVAIDSSSRFKEIKSLINAGDKLRQKFGNDVLAKLAIAKISGDRQDNLGEISDAANENRKSGGKNIRGYRFCHIIDSIKNDAELDLLRLIYGDALLSIGVFSTIETRRENLSQPGAFSENEIDDLVDTDSGEEFAHGQSVRNTFPRCDFFLRVDHAAHSPEESDAIPQILKKLRRLFSLIFQSSIITPNPEEAAMYASASAARNSACLSRQVGAAVTSSTGELLAVGWNDVPQKGGGLYGKPPITHEIIHPTKDQRCFALPRGACFNDREKDSILQAIVDSLVKVKLIDSNQILSAKEAIRDNTRVKDLIEFSRAIHAEMHAILTASRIAGERLVGGKIFVTTYPCHSCARHIVAAGINEIYYIEPYRKSMATKLHSDTLSERADDQKKVRLLQFDGVAPRRFIELFEAGDRKKNGVLSLPRRSDAQPTTKVSLKAIPRLEQAVVAEVTEKELNFPALAVAKPGSDDHGNEPQSPTPSAA
ncbi:MAG: anti-phage dCTP deaminase [Rhodanobacter sp.]